MIASCGSTTRKYNTALTFTETLSREITSWLGTSSTRVRRSTRTICWMPGTTTRASGGLEAHQQEHHATFVLAKDAQGRRPRLRNVCVNNRLTRIL